MASVYVMFFSINTCYMSFLGRRGISESTESV